MFVMKRREFISLLGGAAAWPLAARAQQVSMRRIGVLMSVAEDSAEGQAGVAALVTRLEQLGWSDGRNVLIDYRWSAGDAERLRRNVAELIALSPDVILVSGGTAAVAAVHRPRVRCRSCSRSSLIRSALVSSRAWLGRAATPPGSRSMNTASVRNGWSCSRRSRPG